MIDVGALKTINAKNLARYAQWFGSPHPVMAELLPAVHQTLGARTLVNTVKGTESRLIKLSRIEVADLLEVIRAVKEADRSSEFLNGWSLEVLTDFEGQLEEVK